MAPRRASEDALVGAANYDKLSAAKKLARLLRALSLPAAIPTKLTNLAAFASAQGWADATVALTEIRHGYVHSNKKRRSVVLSASNLVTFEAWQLALWYQELALLRLLDHRGDYQNRLTAGWVGVVERVPWG